MQLAQTTTSRPSTWTIDSNLGDVTAAAKAGDVSAEYALGMKLWLGQGARKDMNGALVWLNRAAAKDYALAETALGVIYDDGEGGVPQDAERAAMQFRRAADKGEALAQFRLGLLYQQGRGLAQDYAAAAKFYQSAAAQGLADAAGNLGNLYAAGLGVQKDLEAARKWLGIAAAAGSEDAKASLARLNAPGTAKLPAAVERPKPKAVAAKDAWDTLKADPFDKNELTGDFSAPKEIEPSPRTGEDGGPREIRVGVGHVSGPYWLGYRIYPTIEVAADAFAKYGKVPSAPTSNIAVHDFSVGIMHGGRPYTLHCAQAHDPIAAPERHEVGCAYFEPDAPVVFIAGTVTNYRDADYPPDAIWKRVGDLTATAYRHAHRVLGLDAAGARGSRPKTGG
jgi:hypothetical protein